MSKLIVEKKIIKTPVLDILKQLKFECNGQYLRIVKPDHGSEHVAITCPFHAMGQESHPSCYVYANTSDTQDLPAGAFHCFTCHETGTLPKLVGKCLDLSYEQSKQWILKNFLSDDLLEDGITLPELTLKRETKKYLDESILKKYEYYHEYMWNRHLNKEVVDRFSIGYDPEAKAITFPIWDEHNNLVEITRRSVEGKRFELAKSTDKPIYLLNFLKNRDFKTIFITESQINALTCHTYHLPAVALCGTGSSHQYDILNSCSKSIHYILCFDGDEAGRNGAQRFIKNVKAPFIDEIRIPSGRDVNDLSKSTFFQILKNGGIDLSHIISDYEEKFQIFQNPIDKPQII